MVSTPEPNSWLDWLDHKFHAVVMFVVHFAMGLTAIIVDLLRQNKLNIRSFLVALGFGLTSGWLSNQICLVNGWIAQMGYLVPLSTIIGYKGMPWLIDNGHLILKSVINRKIDEIEQDGKQ